MPMILIDDARDPRLAIYGDLKASNATRDLDEFVVEGEKLVDQLIESRYPVRSVLLSDRHAGRIGPRIDEAVPAYVVPHAAISRLVGFNFHQGAMASGARIEGASIDRIIEGSGHRLTLVLCPLIHNPENLGAIIRTSHVFGVDAVVVGPSCPDYLSRRVLRVSMGTSLHLPIVRSEDIDVLLAQLGADHGIETIATVTDVDAEPIGRFVRSDRVAIVMGSEAHGLAPDWAARCVRRVTIPMRRGAESLNVAVAAGIFLHHLASDRGT